MKAFTQHTGLVAPLDRANVDTDQIIPKQFLKSIKRTGFGPNLFDEWRYLDVGQPYQDNSKRPLNKDFVLNAERYQGASVLLARENFGCGSSREHAPWALEESEDGEGDYMEVMEYLRVAPLLLFTETKKSAEPAAPKPSLH